MKGGVYLCPRKFTLSNYELFIGDGGWRYLFFISVARTIVGTVLVTGFTSMFSYALSRNKSMMFKRDTDSPSHIYHVFFPRTDSLLRIAKFGASFEYLLRYMKFLVW